MFLNHSASQNMFHQIKIKQLYETIYLLHTNIFACLFACLPVLLHQPDCLICPETKLEDHIIYIRLSSPLFLSVLRWSLLHPWVLDMTVYLNQLPAETSHTHTHIVPVTTVTKSHLAGEFEVYLIKWQQWASSGSRESADQHPEFPLTLGLQHSNLKLLWKPQNCPQLRF